MTYRVGNHQPKNVYRDDAYIGVMFTAEAAALVVEALNGEGLTERMAKAQPGEAACGKRHPEGRYTCERRARHDVCVSWRSGAGADAWYVDYDDLVSQIDTLTARVRELEAADDQLREDALELREREP